MNPQLESDRVLEVELLVVNLIANSEVLSGSSSSQVSAITGEDWDLNLRGQGFRPKGGLNQWGYVLFVGGITEDHVGGIMARALDVAN